MTSAVALLNIMHHIGALVVGVTILGHCHRRPERGSMGKNVSTGQ